MLASFKAILKVLCLTSILMNCAFAQSSIDPQNTRLKSLISWDKNLPTGKDVRMAVIDSGLIQDFPADVILGWNFVDSSNDVLDAEGHGTGSASVIVGLAPDVEIMPLKVTRDGVSNDNILIAAVVYAIKNGAEIINLSISFETKHFLEVKKNVTDEEFSRTLFVIAAGNRKQFIPEKLGENALIVGAALLDPPVQLAIYSDWGPGVEIAAPAGGIDDGITVYRTINPLTYRLYNGTSSAAPVVSGAAAIFKEKYPRLSGKELKKLILTKAKSKSGLAGRVQKNKFLSLD